MNRADLARRADLVEEMDRPDGPEDRLFRTLRQFESLNRLVSRHRHLLARHVLAGLARTPGETRRLADLGAGGCDIARWLVRRARRMGVRLEIIAIERDERIVRYARTANAGYTEIRLVQADIFDTAAWGAPDYAFANHLLHHLPDPQCVELLRRLDAHVRCGYVVSDLERSAAALRAFRLFVAPWFPGGFVAADGAASIRRGFTVPELQALVARATPAHPVRIQRLFPARLALIGGPAMRA